MKNLTLLLLILATFSCAPSMESDADTVCNNMKEALELREVDPNDADAVKAAAETVKKLQDESTAIEDKYKDNEDFAAYMKENCDLAK
jgi:hypothetical protein